MSDFRLFFGGAEEPGWRELLLGEGVENLALSYFHLRKRIASGRLPEIPDGVCVLLDSGAFTANKNPGRMTTDDWRRYEESYCSFVLDNLGRIAMVSEFDSMILGEEHMAEMRAAFWDGIPRDKFLPIWHAQMGEDGLAGLAGRYRRVGLLDADLERSAYQLGVLAAQHQTLFHGVALTKPDLLRELPFASAASTSWLSPSQFGDTIVWDGVQLHRYPKRYKDQARERHRQDLINAGFDADKIERDDLKEVLRLSVWSWLRFEESLQRQRVTHLDVFETEPEEGSSPPAVAHRQPNRREHRVPLPVVSFREVTSTLPTPEGDEQVPSLIAEVSSRSLRRCSTCFVAARCPAADPGSECAFELPVEVATKDQLFALLRGLIEMQAQRVLFARFAEELEGGYPNQNLSHEVDRLMKLVKDLRDLQENREFLKVSIETRAQAGVLSRMFGARNAEPLHALPGSIDADEYIEDHLGAE